MVTEQHQYISILTDEGGLMEVEAAVVAIKTSASPKEYDGYVVYAEVR